MYYIGVYKYFHIARLLNPILFRITFPNQPTEESEHYKIHNEPHASFRNTLGIFICFPYFCKRNQSSKPCLNKSTSYPKI